MAHRWRGRPGREIHTGATGDSIHGLKEGDHQKTRIGAPAMYHRSFDLSLRKSASKDGRMRMCLESKTPTETAPKLILSRTTRITSIGGREYENLSTSIRRKGVTRMAISTTSKEIAGAPSKEVGVRGGSAAEGKGGAQYPPQQQRKRAWKREREKMEHQLRAGPLNRADQGREHGPGRPPAKGQRRGSEAEVARSRVEGSRRQG